MAQHVQPLRSSRGPGGAPQLSSAPHTGSSRGPGGARAALSELHSSVLHLTPVTPAPGHPKPRQTPQAPASLHVPETTHRSTQTKYKQNCVKIRQENEAKTCATIDGGK